MRPFIGRETDLARLRELRRKKSASLVVVTGRRRIGKSRLVEEFSKDFPRFLQFSGLAPDKGIGPRQQRREFIRQLADQCQLPQFESRDWGELFKLLSQQVATGPALILLDEISWMGARDKLFLPKLKVAWDLYFSKNPALILVLCSSISSWVEENVLKSTNFVGRISLELALGELSLPQCNRFWNDETGRISAYEKLKVLGVTGGVPRYLEEIDPQETAEQNIVRLCFRKGAFLYQEFEKLFSDLFRKEAPVYKEILRELAMGEKTYGELSAGLDRRAGGTLSKQLANLVSTGFVHEGRAWSLVDGHELKQAKYRLSDNYSRFYLKYIEPNRAKILKGRYPDQALTFLPAWETVMGLQFENLVLNNTALVFKALNVAAVDVSNDGPYFQKGTDEERGVQIDLLIQDRYNTLYVCEIKFSKDEIDGRVIDSVKEKMGRLKVPRATSMRPVLIHACGVSQAVVQSRFFAGIIPFERFLAGE
jgi:uncharacterized protein